jgi:hypothetical protein
MFTRKNASSPVSGDIEMQEIRAHKRLGRKTRRRLAPNRGVYRERIKLSSCRKVKKTQCLTKRPCKYTNGQSRKYCRKRRNQMV